MVSQFVSPHTVRLLGDLDFNFPEGIHAVGRLDNHSEGLLILTTNKKVTRLLFQGDKPHKRLYLVQVKNIVTETALLALQSGINIRIKGGESYTTPACEVSRVSDPKPFYTFENGLAEYGPATWLLITLMEGKYHQVRKMVAAIGHRCKRLIRISIEGLSLEDLAPGKIKELEETEFFKLANIAKQ